MTDDACSAVLEQIADTELDGVELRARFSQFARQTTDLLYSEAYDRAAAERAGAGLAKLCSGRAELLGPLLKALDEFWSTCLPMPEGDHDGRRVELLCDLAGGFSQAASNVKPVSLAEQQEKQPISAPDPPLVKEEQHDRLRSTAERLQVLHELEKGILSAESTAAIAGIAVHYLRSIIPCDKVLVTRFDQNSNQSVPLAGEDLLDESGRMETLELGHEPLLQELASSSTLLVNDISAMVTYSPGLESLYAAGVRSILCAGLKSTGRLIGALVLTSAQAGTFTDYHADIVAQIASSVAIALQNRLLLETERKARREAETLREVAYGLSSILDREKLLDHILTMLERVLPYDGAIIYLKT
ncbi:MAG: GAF domain-containing protein, partial [Candidatus Promineifilaceae bacterium]